MLIVITHLDRNVCFKDMNIQIVASYLFPQGEDGVSIA